MVRPPEVNIEVVLQDELNVLLRNDVFFRGIAAVVLVEDLLVVLTLLEDSVNKIISHVHQKLVSQTAVLPA